MKLCHIPRQENAECIEGPEIKRLVDCADDPILQRTFVDPTASDAEACIMTTESLPLMTDYKYYNLTGH